MTIHEALMVREIKKHATYRRLAEIYYPEDHDGHGTQGFGEDLCKEALTVLYPHLNVWQSSGENLNAREALKNKSYIGDFFWWE